MRWTALLVAALLAMVVPSGDVAAQETPRAGGVLKVATIGEPPTLDIQSMTTVLGFVFDLRVVPGPGDATRRRSAS